MTVCPNSLTVAVYAVSKRFPREEVYGITSQVRRSAYSVPANIAEGSSRNSKKDYLHFLYIARGSLSETQYFLHLARRLDYLAVVDSEPIESEIRRTFACLHGLIQAVEAEAGAMRKIIASATSLIVIGLSRFSINSP